MMNQDQSVSMADVALAAGVSKMTVSRVLRADAKVAEATRLRVLAEVKRLGYRANPEASRAMAQFVRKGIRRNPSVLGVIALELGEFHEKDNPNRAPIWRGIETEAASLGYLLNIFYPLRDGISPKALGEILKARGIRCVLITAPPLKNTRFAIDLRGIAAATFDETLVEPALIRVGENRHQHMVAVFAELQRRKVKKVGYITHFRHEARLNINHISGFEWAARCFPQIETVPLLEMETEMDQVAAWLAEHSPDVVIGRVAVYERLAFLGYRMPEDFGFVSLSPEGAGDLAGVARLDPNLEEVGRITVSTIHQRFLANQTGSPLVERTILVDGQWHEGRTLVGGC